MESDKNSQDNKTDIISVKNKLYSKRGLILTIIGIILIIVIFIFRYPIFYNVKFGIPIPYKYEKQDINFLVNPIQKDINKKAQDKNKFIYRSLINGNKIEITPKAFYKIRGLAVAYNKFIPDKNDYFDTTALYDIGIAWGELGRKDFYQKYFESYSEKDEKTGARLLWTKEKYKEMPVSTEYANSHFSHSHIIPANRNIMSALRHIKKWDLVELDGLLVDTQYNNGKGKLYFSKTSLSREDSGIHACETIYVTRVKIGHILYK